MDKEFARKQLSVAKRVAKLLDEQFSFLGFKFGLDPIVGLIPGLGDAVVSIASIYIVFIAYKAGMPSGKLVAMTIRILADYLIGSIPLIGDMFDFFYKANTRNMAVLEEYLGK